MKLTIEQYEQIKDCFAKQRKPAKISNLEVLNAVLYIVENGCKWRSLPKEYGDWHVIYWAKKSPAFAAVGYHPGPSKCGEPDTLEVQRWVNEYLRGILGGRCAGRSRQRPDRAGR